MVSIARKNLFHNKGRLFANVTGIAFAILLILILEGFAAGLFEQSVAFIENSGADLIVAQAGVDNMQTSRSALPAFAGDQIYGIRGVNNVAGIVTVPVMFEHQGHKTPVMLIGYKPGQRLGAPWKLAAGRRPKTSREAVFDFALAKRNGLKVGDRPKLLGKKVRLVGLSLQTQSFMNPYVFVTRSGAGRLLGDRVATSYLLVDLEKSSFSPHVKLEIEDTTKAIDVLTRDELAANDRTILEDIMRDPVNLMVGIAYFIGFLVIGLTVYTSVLEKLPEFGTLKAVGAGNRQLYFIVWNQSLLTVLAAVALGVGMAFAAETAVEGLIPRFEILLTVRVFARVFIGSVSMAVLAAFLPARRVAGIEPAAVFE